MLSNPDVWHVEATINLLSYCATSSRSIPKHARGLLRLPFSFMTSCPSCSPKIIGARCVNKSTICLQQTVTCHRCNAYSCKRVILSQAARWPFRLPYCCSQFMDALMDPNDQALMDGLAALGPLLLGSRKHHEGSVEEQHPKRHKAKAKEEQDLDGHNKEAITTLLRLMGQLLLNHERSIQLNQRQDCFVLFCQNRPEGIVPHLTMLASKWREEWPQQKDNLRWPNLRTYLMKGVITELLRRVQQLAATKPGDQLWDVAVSKGTIHPDGSWGYQKWSQETKQLIKASRSPVAMAQMIRNLQILEEQFQSNAHVVRFQSLKNTQSSQEAIPWILQISHREAEAWELLVELCHNTVWSLLGMSAKQHSQVLSKPALLLQQAMGKGQNPQGKSRGRGKGKTSQSP